MDRCEEIRNYHNTKLPKIQKTKEEARTHLAEIKSVSEQIQGNSDTH